MKQRRWGILMLWMLSLMLFAAPSFAQSGKVVIDNNGVDIDESRINTAARQLTDKGALVVVVLTDSTGGQSETAYLDSRLKDLGIGNSSKAGDRPNNVLIYYVSFDPRYSSILPGSAYNQALTTGNQSDAIRNNQLNAGLKANDPTRGLVDALTATSRVISDPAGAASSSSQSSSSSSGIGSSLVWIIVIIALVAIGFFVVPGLLKRRSSQAAEAGAQVNTRARFDQAKKNAGIAIADLAQAMRDAGEKQRFDKISYPTTQANELEKRHRAAESSFTQIKVQFDDINERIDNVANPSVTDLEGAAGGYDGITNQVRQLTSELQAMDGLRKELDTINAQAPAEVDRAKKW
ncbi:TPM domain-containing protein [Herpetosiphon geysericola]|uniref:TPM domain-containing protein n=1 Tax=Herpetosiphon geysericola TaxID=70996 RepID=A0A0P6XSU5_9CHLR|nr:TPM domain-containing protein [Herpetosiphon geysericola]KPL86112.1 hypothetical protein SE18_14685 [Herpetosiphon geysericola]